MYPDTSGVLLGVGNRGPRSVFSLKASMHQAGREKLSSGQGQDPVWFQVYPGLGERRPSPEISVRASHLSDPDPETVLIVQTVLFDGECECILTQDELGIKHPW